MVAVTVALGALTGQPFAQTAATPFDWDRLPANTWTRMTTAGSIPKKNFHAGMTIDSDRDVLLVFGAETHESASNYDNSVWRLDLRTLVWSRDYPPDAIGTYTRTATGTLRTTAGRPWADHAFDVVDYVPPLGKMVIVQWPEHAFRLKKSLKGAHASTWLYDPGTRHWQVLAAAAPKLFCTVYDSDAQKLVGYDGRETHIFDSAAGTWRTYAIEGGPAGYHLSLTYDSVLKQVLAYGDQDGRHELYAFDLARLAWRKVVTPHHPPGAAGAAIVYASEAKALLLLAPAPGRPVYSNDDGSSETWAFDSISGDWRKLPVASPPVFGVNYHRAYDTKRNVFLYGERDRGTRADGAASLTIWAFRYVPDAVANQPASR